MIRSLQRLLVRTIQFLLLVFGIIAALFAVHAWRASNSDFIARAQKGASSYSCVGDRLLPPPRQELPAITLARAHRFDAIPAQGEQRGPFIVPRLVTEAATALAFKLLYSPAELNQMHATLRLGPFANFDDMALRLFDTRYCKLSVDQRTLVGQFHHSYSFPRFHKLLLEAGELEAADRLMPLTPKYKD